MTDESSFAQFVGFAHRGHDADVAASDHFGKFADIDSSVRALFHEKRKYERLLRGHVHTMGKVRERLFHEYIKIIADFSRLRNR